MKILDERETQKTTTTKIKQRQKGTRGNRSYSERMRGK